jgi:hypothetical protein
VRFLVANLKSRSRSVFAFYNDRGECENRIEEFKNGFAADRLSCHRFRANAFRLLLHSFAYNLVNLFRLQLPSSLRSTDRNVTWPADGLSGISSKPPATLLRLSRRFDNLSLACSRK